MTEIAQVDAPPPPSAIITLDPTSYVAAVYAPFREKLDAAKAEADKAEFDITTTAGMEIAKKHRAVFRDEFRLAIEKARAERKAPILEIGRLLDGRAKEITAEVAPYEKRFDDAIKAEEQRKADIKAAKEEAERQRVAKVREAIDFIRAFATNAVGMAADKMAAMLETLEAEEISLERYQEFAGEAELVKAATVLKLSAMLESQQLHEAEQQRLAEERAELDRQRAEQAERERLAAEARAAEEARLRAEREAHEAELRRQTEAQEAELAAQRAELQRQQDELNAARAEQERKEREAREAAEAADRAKQEAEEAAARAEAQRVADEKAAAEAEQARRDRVQFELNGPTPSELVSIIAGHYMVEQETALNWLCRHEWAAVEVAA